MAGLALRSAARARAASRRTGEAAAAGHLDIQEKQVRLQLLDLRQGFLGVPRFTDDLDLGVRFEQAPQLGAAQAFVVHDQGFHAGLKGMEISATTDSLS
jgi:hypothetical protein